MLINDLFSYHTFEHLLLYVLFIETNTHKDFETHTNT